MSCRLDSKAVLAAIQKKDGEAAAAGMLHHVEQAWIQFEKKKPNGGAAIELAIAPKQRA